MPIIFTKDLVKQFLVVGLCNPRAVIYIYFSQLNANTHEQGGWCICNQVEEWEKGAKQILGGCWRYLKFWDLKIFEITRRYMQLFAVVSS